MRHSESVYLGNVHRVPAGWSAKEEDRWYFTQRHTMSQDGRVVVRSDTLLQGAQVEGTDAERRRKVWERMTLVVEFVLRMRRTVAGKEQLVDYSVAWTELHLGQLMGFSTSKVVEVELKGGTQQAPRPIDPGDVLQRRAGVRALVRAFTGRDQPALKVEVTPVQVRAARGLSMEAVPPPVVLLSLPLDC